MCHPEKFRDLAITDPGFKDMKIYPDTAEFLLNDFMADHNGLYGPDASKFFFIPNRGEDINNNPVVKHEEYIRRLETACGDKSPDHYIICPSDSAPSLSSPGTSTEFRVKEETDRAEKEAREAEARRREEEERHKEEERYTIYRRDTDPLGRAVLRAVHAGITFHSMLSISRYMMQIQGMKTIHDVAVRGITEGPAREAGPVR